MKNSFLLLIPVFLLCSCADQHLVIADKAYDRMAYAKATCQYEKALGRKDDREAALRAASAYVALNQPGKAVDWYAYAERSGSLTAEQSVAYGQALRRMGQDVQAMRAFELALAQDPSNTMVQELLLSAGSTPSFYSDSNRFIVAPISLSGMVNTFSAVPFNDGIVFVGEKTETNSNRNPWNGLAYLDLYAAKPQGIGMWSAATALPGVVNGRFHEGPLVFNKEENEMYFTRSDYYKFRLNKDGSSTSHLMLFRAQKQPDGSWDKIHMFAYNGESFSCGHPALSEDGNILFYISDMPGGEGGTDIYRCLRTPEGWSKPENLGYPINTAGNEMFPTMHGDTLYFASNGHQGMGGLDIFKSIHDQEGWSIPRNLNYPINTQHDDFSFVMLPGGLAGYLSSNRGGNDEVHTFFVQEPTLNVVGTFLEFGTDELLEDVEVRLLDLTAGKDIDKLTGPDGEFSFPLEAATDYRLVGSKDGMLSESRELTTRGQRTDRTWREDFHLHRIDMDRSIIVDNIYYDYDQWEIREDAAIELNKLAALFKANPDVRFELSSHTDSRASINYNLVLSEARANGAVSYLIQQGVDPHRITAKGYGELNLVNRCKDGVECSEDEHQANRRTEFRVVGIENVVYDYPATRSDQ